MYVSHQALMDIWSQQSCLKNFDLHLCRTLLQVAACLVFLWWQQIKALWNRSYLLPVNISGSLKERTSKPWGLLTKRSFLCCNKIIRNKTKRMIYIYIYGIELYVVLQKNKAGKSPAFWFSCFICFTIWGIFLWTLIEIAALCARSNLRVILHFQNWQNLIYILDIFWHSGLRGKLSYLSRSWAGTQLSCWL